MRHNPRQRITAGLLALLAQAGLIALFTQSRVQPTTHAEAESMHLVFIQPLLAPEVATPLRDKAPATNQTVRSTVPASRDRIEPEVPGEPVEPPEPTRAITVEPVAAPRIDWNQQMAMAVGKAVEDIEAGARDNPLDSKPRVLVMPAERGDGAGTTAMRLGNGDLITEHRISDKLTVKCLHEHVPVWLTFDITAQHLPPKCYPMDTRPSIAPVIENAKPEYLRRPLPLPKQPQTPAQR